MEESRASLAQQQTGQVRLPGVTGNTPAPTAVRLPGVTGNTTAPTIVNNNGAALGFVGRYIAGTFNMPTSY